MLRESLLLPHLCLKRLKELCLKTCNFCLKKNVVVLPTFYECSLDIRIVASIKRILQTKTQFASKQSVTYERKKRQALPITTFFFLIWEISTLSQILLNCIFHLLWRNFYPFLLFSLPLLILSENLVLQMPDFFFSKMWCSLTHCHDFPVLYFFWKTLWPVLPQCVTVWRKNQQINDLYWLTIFRKNWKIAFWSALCSAGC